MVDILFKILQCAGFLVIAFVVFAVLFELVCWVVEKFIDDEQG